MPPQGREADVGQLRHVMGREENRRRSVSDEEEKKKKKKKKMKKSTNAAEEQGITLKGTDDNTNVGRMQAGGAHGWEKSRCRTMNAGV
ncbi:hypothetical protein MKX07_006538 [Trichoderma sp. CBMAI-0711]|nr:hypothetical protein MKX07_006538 [Trichoderma sp. CBMAI-0711]